MSRRRALLAATLLLPLCGGTRAQGQRLDDSASPRSRVPAQVVLGDSGRPLVASPFSDTALVRFGRIDYRLATAAYIGHQARIRYVVPSAIAGLRSPRGLRVEWRALPPLASGAGRPGDHVPVWSGLVTQPLMNVSLELTAQVDLRELQTGPTQQFGFECYFEIEVLR